MDFFANHSHEFRLTNTRACSNGQLYTACTVVCNFPHCQDYTVFNIVCHLECDGVDIFIHKGRRLCFGFRRLPN